ncbi:MAG: hypothetical protein PHO70_03265 [Candidatus Omnitrophica bacterium]|nr:hypothetical protein [Candidatus Omnitrophota bacterium]
MKDNLTACSRIRKKKAGNRAFALAEVLLALGILAFTMSGILLVLANTSLLSTLSKNSTIAINTCQSRMEEMQNLSYDAITALNGTTFLIPSGSGVAGDNIGIGRIEVGVVIDRLLLRVRVVASFRNKNSIIGEDANLDGDVTGAEDTNGNGRYDSPIELITLVPNYGV